MSNDEVTTQRRRFIICCDMTKGRLCHVPAFFRHSWTTLDALHRIREVLQGDHCKSNGLGWFARFRTQFLPDHYNDPFLSSVCLFCRSSKIGQTVFSWVVDMCGLTTKGGWFWA